MHVSIVGGGGGAWWGAGFGTFPGGAGGVGYATISVSPGQTIAASIGGGGSGTSVWVNAGGGGTSTFGTLYATGGGGAYQPCFCDPQPYASNGYSNGVAGASGVVAPYGGAGGYGGSGGSGAIYITW